MPTYKAITPLVAFDGFTKSGDFNHVPVEHLRLLDGLKYDDEEFVAYMEEPLTSLVVKSSGIKLFLDEGDCRLKAATYFETARELTEQEIAQLKDYYYGQMCDGIGENFLCRIKSREDVGYRLEVFGLYDSTIGPQLRIDT